MGTGVWDDYWENPVGAGAAGENCLPYADDIIDTALQKFWTNFAQGLPRNAKILDLATGNGVVLKRITAKRRDIKAVGIDQAANLPKAGGGIRLMAGKEMENTGFPNGAFHAVTSQFGAEYGDLSKIAQEVARLLRPGGVFAFICHRSPGPVVEHNLPRLECLRWAREEMKVIDKALNWLAQRSLLGAALPPFFAQLPQQAMAKFGAGSAAHEFSEAVRRSLVVGMQRPPHETAAMLADLDRLSANEMGRISALAEAALCLERCGEFAVLLSEAGLEVSGCEGLEQHAPGGDFAWAITGSK